MQININTAIDIIISILIYIKFIKNKTLINTIMYFYITGVIFFTLMPITTSLHHIFTQPYKSIHLIPFDDYIHRRGDALRQIILNIIMMIPFGFLLPQIKKQNIITIIIYTFLFSLTIELTQPLLHMHRASDITDLITNTIGGIIGYLFYRFFSKIKPH